MKEDIDARFVSLLRDGQALVQRLPRNSSGGYDFWVDSYHLSAYQSWLSAVGNLLRVASPESGHYPKEMNALLSQVADQMQHSIPPQLVARVHGLLGAAYSDWQSGLLGAVEFTIAAATFDDFLDHASRYHKGNKKTEAAVLAGAVLEDTVKKIAAKHEVSTDGRSLEDLLDALAKADVITPVKVKRFKAAAGVRNHALHAEWDKFDIKDAGTLIAAVRELVADYL